MEYKNSYLSPYGLCPGVAVSDSAICATNGKVHAPRTAITLRQRGGVIYDVCVYIYTLRGETHYFHLYLALTLYLAVSYLFCNIERVLVVGLMMKW